MTGPPVPRPPPGGGTAPAPGSGGLSPSILQGIWKWINAQANKSVGGVIGSIADFVRTAAEAMLTTHLSFDALTAAIRRLGVWERTQLRGIIDFLIWPAIQKDRRMINHVRVLALRYAANVLTWSERYAKALFLREQRARKIAIAEQAGDIRIGLKALHRIIEQEAASGYRIAYPERVSLITRLADVVARDNPIIRPLVRDVVAGVLDLASIDNPVARLALGFLLKQIIDRLGIDKVAGKLLDDLLRPILGNPRPHDLHGVIADVSARLGALESQQATFMADGGPEILQAGEEWQALTSPAGSVALLALFGVMAVDPAGFARDTTAALGTVVTDTIRAADALIRGV